jgi:hypothetical protein
MDFESIKDEAGMLKYVKKSAPEEVAKKLTNLKLECEEKGNEIVNLNSSRKKLGKVCGNLALAVVEDAVTFHDELIERGMDPESPELSELRTVMQRLAGALKK